MLTPGLKRSPTRLHFRALAMPLVHRQNLIRKLFPSALYYILLSCPVLAQLPNVTGSGTIGTVPVWTGTNQIGSTSAIDGVATGSLFVAGPGPWIDVTASPYNAVPDCGSTCTDNTTAIRAAIAACPATGCTIYFPFKAPASGLGGGYYVHGSGGFGFGVGGSGAPSVRFVGECVAPGSGQSGTSAVTCSTIVSDAAITILRIGTSGTKMHGVEVQDLAFQDTSPDHDTVNGAVRLINTEDFNLTNVRCQDMQAGYCIQLDGGTTGFTQFGVIINPSVANTKIPIQTNGNTSEINLYGGNLGCTGVSGTTIGMDIGHTNAPGAANGEWGVYGTHILDCDVGVWGNGLNVMDFHGVAELLSDVSGSVGFEIDSGGGDFIGGSLNNFQTCIKLGTSTSIVTDTRIAASLTPHTAMSVPDSALVIDPQSLPTTLILAPENYPSSTTPPTGSTASGSQFGSDLILFSQNAAATPTALSLLTTIANTPTATSTTNQQLAKLSTAASPATVTETVVTDTQGAVGIVVNNGGSSSATTYSQIATVGQANCFFDNGTTVGDYVTISSSTAGYCHDYGPGYPPSGQVLGMVLSTNTGIGQKNPVFLFGPGQIGSAPLLRSSVALTDDFFSAGTTSGTIGELGWSTNMSGGNPSKIAANSADHPGLLQMATTTTNNTIALVFLGTQTSSTEPIFSLSGHQWRAVFVASEDAGTTNANTKMVVRLGFGHGLGNPPTDGIFFENKSTTSAGTWNGFAKTGASSTSSGGTLAMDTNFHTFEIRDDGQDNIMFLIDGQQYGSIVSTNVPSSPMIPFFEIVNTEATNKLLDVDAFQLTMQVAR